MVNSEIVLGHIISDRGIEVDKAKVEQIFKLPPPRTVRDVRSFLGHAGFYRRFIKDFFQNLQISLWSSRKGCSFEFTLSYLEAFERLKTELTSAPIIRPLNWNLLFEVMCDAFDYAVGVILGQWVDKLPHVIRYANKMLNDAQLNHSTTEKELLAVIFALDKFHPYLIGSEVLISPITRL